MAEPAKLRRCGIHCVDALPVTSASVMGPCIRIAGHSGDHSPIQPSTNRDFAIEQVTAYQERFRPVGKCSHGFPSKESCRQDCGHAWYTRTKPDQHEFTDIIEMTMNALDARAAAAAVATTTDVASSEAIRKALGMSTPWPIDSILTVLIDAVEHLLSIHDCDCHGHEKRRYALDAAKRMRVDLRHVLSVPEKGIDQ